MALIPPQFLDSVIAIGSKGNDGNIHWTGTGFLYGKLIEESKEPRKKLYKTFLITNKHVLEGLTEIEIRLNTDDGKSTQDFNFPLEKNGKKLLFLHPSDKVDVAVVPINANIFKQMKLKFYFMQDDSQVLTIDKMKDSGVSEGDFVYTLGYPLGVISKERQNVTLRLGAISRIRDLFENCSDDFIIDASIFPGNSGGPVILKPEFVSVGKTKTIKNSYLIGMVQSYIAFRDIAISQQSQRTRIIFEEHSGLSQVIPMDYIVEAVSLYLKQELLRLI